MMKLPIPFSDVAGRMGKGVKVGAGNRPACVSIFECGDWMQYADRPHETQSGVQRREFADFGLLHY
jgi:hypothetical protein